MHDAGCDIAVRLTPRADRDALGGVRDGVLQARVTAPPADGRANAALVKLLASALGVPKSRISLVRGQTSRDKVLRIAGLDADDVRARLGAGPGR